MVQGLTAVLFDLDGTLADTAPDLGFALNTLLTSRGLPALSLESIRPEASNGVRGLLGLGFSISPQDPGYEALRLGFLEIYMENLCRNTRLFEGMTELIEKIEEMGVPWGIVTNKPMKYTEPLVKLLGLDAGVVVGGDSCSHAKPHPEPLLFAAERLAVSPSRCLYVGDDRRDVEASLAAGMTSIVANYGYLSGGNQENWGAHGYIDHPLDLLAFID
ncbi:MAG TPA: HAD-IA family hydrolase [Burkholderiales bacterium]|nr:HAD-IA family hydrolase [Burkholderiales bacterium]